MANIATRSAAENRRSSARKALAMLHCPEGSVVLGQQHVTADTMKAEKIEPNKSKDALSLRKSLEWCATSLPTLRAVIVDACSSAPKLFNEIIKPRFPSAFLAEDAWHHDKNLKADLKKV